MIRKLALVALLLSPTPVATQTPSVPNWQSTEAASIHLGVRDKYGTLGNYEATFVVTTPDGLKLMKAIKVEGNDWGDVTFPDDFNAPAKYIGGTSISGRYRWECFVRGEVATRGEFTLSLSPAPVRPARRRRSRQ